MVSAKISIGLTLLFLCSGVSDAVAQVSASKVWAKWRDLLDGAGYDVTAQENRDGDSLTLQDLTLTFASDDGDIKANVTVAELSMNVAEDKRIQIEFPQTIPIKVELRDAAATKFDVTLNLASDSLRTFAEGTVDDIYFTYDAATIDLKVDSVTENDVPWSADEYSFDLRLSGINGFATINPPLIRHFLMGDGVDIEVRFIDRTTTEQFRLSGKSAAFTFEDEGFSVNPLSAQDVVNKIKQGLSKTRVLSVHSGEISTLFKSRNEDVATQSSIAQSRFEATLEKTRQQQQSLHENISFRVESSAATVPITGQVGRVQLDVERPVIASAELQDFRLAGMIKDIRLADAVWNEFDPQGHLPREASNIAIDFAGETLLSADSLDFPFHAMTKEPQLRFGGVRSVKINGINATAMGAVLAATGQFMISADDFPVGEMNVTITNGSELIDRLVAANVMPDELATAARAALGLLAKPGEAENILTSRIEFNDRGQVIANGQRLR